MHKGMATIKYENRLKMTTFEAFTTTISEEIIERK
jgi:hypothetical protein